ncbi:hypothetical protein DFJ58DRAFT_781442 [Suillus subalutaceus]|uniref:uncharacterized protein n=1 Tax=Suillus subalutaceus TaxID=48586 RepID=UPI001B88362E|nr:uncharacterized protein DFJ58DRAFT_781442 [Suillus subalutaceus]KAG1858742.1 hypothetical protein DFJ58DRAFT_781442 [Suillus subalutaceus]
MLMRWTSHLLPVPAGLSKPGPNVKPLPTTGIMEDVDLATIKPTFIPRGSKPKDAEKKEKKNKKQKGSKDEDGGESLSLTAARQKHRDRDDERSRKKKLKDWEGDGSEDMWVENPLPDIMKALPITDVSPGEGSQARKRAIDFM